MTTCTAVLLDTTAIQSYIFSSNKMRENLGASFLVKHIYSNEVLGSAIAEASKVTVDVDAWKTAASDLTELTNEVEIGFIGGGKALVFFAAAEQARKFIYCWTSHLLVIAPGLTTAAAIEEFRLADFPGSMSHLFEKLAINKSNHKPLTVIPRHGITAECRLSGLSMDIWNARQQDYVSVVSDARINAGGSSSSDREDQNDQTDFVLDARKQLNSDFRSCLGDNYCLGNELNRLGSVFGEDSKIAIVHIDGNDMGLRFSKTGSLGELRQLAVALQQTNQIAMEGLLTHIATEYNTIMAGLGFNLELIEGGEHQQAMPYDTGAGKRILPILPLVYGGDDITFVCDGKLGLYYAEIFIRELEKINLIKEFTVCAGVSITNYKYPFYRGYSLAEELCASAKARHKKPGTGNQRLSFIDFHLSGGALAGSLEQIRRKFYQAPQGELLARPYAMVAAGKSVDINSYEELLDNSSLLLHDFPASVRHNLLRALSGSEAEGRQFLKHCNFRNRKLPKVKAHPQIGEQLFAEKYTPYFDMIELLSVYPEWALENRVKNTRAI